MLKKFLIVFYVMLFSLPVYALDQNQTINTILNRKSVRKYTNQQVSQEQIDLMLKAAMAAPSGMNKQPWEFIVIQDKKILDSVTKIVPYASYAKNSSVTVIVCGNTDESPDLWMQDCCAATENLLLAVESMKLGAVWCAVYPDNEKISGMQKLLKLPKNIIPLNVIPIGYPEGNDKPKDKYKKVKIHVNSW